MGYLVLDFECTNSDCKHVFEELLGRDEPLPVCPLCGSPTARLISAPAPASYSMLDQDGKAKVLRKRSREHTIKELKKDPTQIKQKKLKLK